MGFNLMRKEDADQRGHLEQESGTARSERRAILGVDIGGTFVKASVVDKQGFMLASWQRAQTPKPATLDALIGTIKSLAKHLPAFDAISIAFPGVVKNGTILTAPNLGTEQWRGTNLADAVAQSFSRDVRILNDAIVQGLGVVKGPGLDCVLTLGTGLGCALFREGKFIAQLELGRHTARENLCYDAYVGQAAFLELKSAAWNERVRTTIDAARKLFNFDHLYLGGGNSRRLDFELNADTTIIPMTAGITGAARLWDEDWGALAGCA